MSTGKALGRGNDPRSAGPKPAVLPMHQPRMERMKGVEPSSSAWKAEALPLSDIRMERMTSIELATPTLAT